MRTAAGCMEAVEEELLHLSFTEVKAAMGMLVWKYSGIATA